MSDSKDASAKGEAGGFSGPPPLTGVQSDGRAGSFNSLPPLPLVLSVASGNQATVTANFIPGPETLHREVLARVAVVEQVLTTLTVHGGPGHNNPPLSDSDRNALENVLSTLKAQPPTPADTTDVKNAVRILRATADAIWIYARDKVDLFLTEAAKSAGNEFGKRVVQSPFWLYLLSALQAVVLATSDWLAALIK